MESETHVLALIQAIDAGARGPSNLHALVSSLTTSSVGSQDALARAVVMLESFHQAVHRAMLRDDEHAATVADLLQHWYLQGGVHTKTCVAQTIPYLAHACLEQLQQGRASDPVARVLLAICNKEIQLRPDQQPFKTPNGQIKRLKPIPPIEEITRFNVSAVLGLALKQYHASMLDFGDPAIRRYIFLACAILGTDPSTVAELQEQTPTTTNTELQVPQLEFEGAVAADALQSPDHQTHSEASAASAPRFKSLLASLGFTQADESPPRPASTGPQQVAAATAGTSAAPAKAMTVPSGVSNESESDVDEEGGPALYRSQYRGFHALEWLALQHWLSSGFLQLLKQGITVCLGQLPGRPEYSVCLRLISMLQHAGITKADFGMLVSTNSQLALFNRYPFAV